MKQFINALSGVIMDILEFLAVVGERIWHGLKCFVRWFIPRAKSASVWGKQKLKKEWEELPDQIEWVKNTAREKSEQVHEKASQFRENWPEHKQQMREMAQQSVKAVSNASQRTKEAFYQGAAAIHRNVEKFKESIDVPEPEDGYVDDDAYDDESDSGTVIVMHPAVKPDTVKEPDSPAEAGSSEPRRFQFQKRHLWVIIGICAIVGALISIKKHRDAEAEKALRSQQIINEFSIMNTTIPSNNPYPTSNSSNTSNTSSKTKDTHINSSKFNRDIDAEMKAKATIDRGDATMSDIKYYQHMKDQNEKKYGYKRNQ